MSPWRSTVPVDAMKVAEGKVGRKPLVIAAMDFSFIGGSMGSVVGEKIARACDYCIENKIPLMIISKSGGARMMEAAYSLMQMAKTSAKLAALARAGVPYFSFMTDPTTGGVTASYAMLGDINFSEVNARINDVFNVAAEDRSDLLKSGGMYGMLNTLLLIFCAMTFSG